MKSGIIITGALAAALAAVGLAGCVSEGPEPARLQALARIGREQAARTALIQAPGGTIKAGELEDDNGTLTWWFDIVTPGSKNVTEVSVDGRTGGVISVATEVPEN